MKHHICGVARVIACASFLVLTIIGVSSVVRAMSLDTIANENGIPSSWQIASLGNPETITVPVTYWDQRQDDCNDQNRQFEWTICGYWTRGALQGIVKNTLGADGLPVPSFTNSIDAWNTNYDVFTANVTGNDPVQPTDNFYRWFHEVPGLSQQINGRTATFTRVNNSNTYVYGRDGVFPLDDVAFSDSDEATNTGHNFHFTSHLHIPVKIAADGTEEFYFSGDDDVWVFLNDQLVLDIGGLHEKLEGRFKINQDGTVTTYVQHVNDPSNRDEALGTPSNDYDIYVGPLNEYNESTFSDITKTINIGLNEGDVVNLDFFYAERSTSESNTNITITNMNWPISADSEITAEIVGRIENTDNRLIEFNTHIKNRDPENPLDLERFAAYIIEETEEGTTSGFLPLDRTTLFYTATPEDETSWQAVEISAPDNSTSGFNLATPIRMAPSGQAGDTLYFRYYGESSDKSGTMSSTVSYYTTLDGNAGVTYDYDKVAYTIKPTTPEPNPDPEDPNPDPEPPRIPVIPDTNIIDGELEYLAPLGEVAFVPNTGVISDAISAIFEESFAEIILSQGFVMAMLLIFAGSFATYFSLRKFANLEMSAATNAANVKRTSKSYAKTSKKTMPKAAKPAKKMTRSNRTMASKSSRSTKTKK